MQCPAPTQRRLEGRHGLACTEISAARNPVLLSSQVRQHQCRLGAWKRTHCFLSCSQRAQGWFNICTVGQAGFLHCCIGPRPISIPQHEESTSGLCESKTQK